MLFYYYFFTSCYIQYIHYLLPNTRATPPHPWRHSISFDTTSANFKNWFNSNKLKPPSLSFRKCYIIFLMIMIILLLWYIGLGGWFMRNEFLRIDQNRKKKEKKNICFALAFCSLRCRAAENLKFVRSFWIKTHINHNIIQSALNIQHTKLLANKKQHRTLLSSSFAIAIDTASANAIINNNAIIINTA